MQAQLLIAAGAGLVSAALFASLLTATPLAVLIFYLCPLPLCVVGLSMGRQASGLAAAVGVLLIALILGPLVGAVFALVTAMPAVVLVHLAFQQRTMPNPVSGGPPLLAWYPIGQLIAMAALAAGIVAGLFLLLLGPDMASYQAYMDNWLPIIHETLSKDVEWTEEQTEALRSFLTRAFPAMVAISWMSVSLLNLWLAGKIVTRSGHALRPWPNFRAIELPGWLVIALAVALAATFLPGMIGLIATGFSGAILFAYFLQGMAVIHFFTRSIPFRTAILVIVYLSALLIVGVATVIAIIGVAEPLFGSRARLTTSADADDKPIDKNNEH